MHSAGWQWQGRFLWKGSNKIGCRIQMGKKPVKIPEIKPPVVTTAGINRIGLIDLPNWVSKKVGRVFHTAIAEDFRNIWYRYPTLDAAVPTTIADKRILRSLILALSGDGMDISFSNTFGTLGLVDSDIVNFVGGDAMTLRIRRCAGEVKGVTKALTLWMPHIHNNRLTVFIFFFQVFAVCERERELRLFAGLDCVMQIFLGKVSAADWQLRRLNLQRTWKYFFLWSRKRRIDRHRLFHPTILHINTKRS